MQQRLERNLGMKVSFNIIKLLTIVFGMFEFFKSIIPIKVKVCLIGPSGGIGRHKGLKIPR